MTRTNVKKSDFHAARWESKSTEMDITDYDTMSKHELRLINVETRHKYEYLSGG
jgi:hypothetical protein